MRVEMAGGESGRIRALPSVTFVSPLLGDFERRGGGEAAGGGRGVSSPFHLSYHHREPPSARS